MNPRRYRKDLEHQLEYICFALNIPSSSVADKNCLTIDGNNRMYRVERILESGGAEAFFGPERRTAAELYEYLYFARMVIEKTKQAVVKEPAPHSDGEADLHFRAKPETDDMAGLFTISKPGAGPICVDMPMDEAVGCVTQFMEELAEEAMPDDVDENQQLPDDEAEEGDSGDAGYDADGFGKTTGPDARGFDRNGNRKAYP
jgi:hypothetical protein